MTLSILASPRYRRARPADSGFQVVRVFGYCSARTGAFGCCHPTFKAPHTLIPEKEVRGMQKPEQPNRTTSDAARAERRQRSGGIRLSPFLRNAFTLPFRVDPEAVAASSGGFPDHEPLAPLFRLILTTPIL